MEQILACSFDGEWFFVRLDQWKLLPSMKYHFAHTPTYPRLYVIHVPTRTLLPLLHMVPPPGHGTLSELSASYAQSSDDAIKGQYQLQSTCSFAWFIPSSLRTPVTWTEPPQFPQVVHTAANHATLFT